MKISDSEVRAYEELADVMSENNWHKFIDRLNSTLHKTTAFHVKKKERAAKLPKEDRFIYVSRWSKVEYKNISAVERQAY